MIQYTILSQYEEKYAPPDQDVLKVSTVGDIAFLSIGKHTETATDVTFTEGEGSSHWSGDALDLIVSVFNGCSSDVRGQIRMRLDEQQLEAARARTA
jgi:hypothetical protein